MLTPRFFLLIPGSPYRDLVEEQRATVPGSVAAPAEAATITFRAPDGLSDVYTMSGRHISIDVDRLVHVSERDAVPLRQAGWQEFQPCHRPAQKKVNHDG
jgi:hypothetical protein